MEDKRSKYDEIAGCMSSGENDVWRFYPCDTFREAEDMQRRFAGNGERCEIGENGRGWFVRVKVFGENSCNYGREDNHAD